MGLGTGRVAPPLCACDRDGSVAALLRIDGSISLIDVATGAPINSSSTNSSTLSHDKAAAATAAALPTAALAVAHKRARVVARADAAGTLVVVAVATAADKEHKDDEQQDKDVVVVAAALPDPPRPLALDATDALVVAAGGAANELVVVPLVLRRRAAAERHGGNARDDDQWMKVHDDKDENADGRREPDRAAPVRRFPLAQDHRSTVSAVAVAPEDDAIVVCCQAVTLVDAASGIVLQRYAGHQTPVTAVAFLAPSRRITTTSACARVGDPLHPASVEQPSNQVAQPCPQSLFVTACAGDPFLSVWQVSQKAASAEQPASKKRRKDAKHNKSGTNTSAYHTFIAPEKGVRALTVDHGGDAKTCTISFAALLPSGAIAVWKDWSVNSSTRTTKSSFILRPAPCDTVLFAAFPKSAVLSVGRGHALRPELFSVSLTAVDTDLLDMPASNTRGLLAADDTADRGKDASNAALTRAEGIVPHALRDAAFGGLERSSGSAKASKLADPPLANGRFPRKPSLDDNLITEGGGEGPVGSEEEGEDVDDGEPTFEEKLALLGVAVPGVSKTSDHKDQQEGVVGLIKAGPVDSFASVISQAIRAKDDNLLDSILSSARKSVQIQQTVSRMPVELATTELLDALVGRLVRHPKRADSLVPWIREILMEHAGALMNRRKTPHLDTLMHAITARVEALPGLSRLEGRLELVVAQADRVRAAKKTFAGQTVAQVEYLEKAVEGTDGASDGVSSTDDSSEDEEDADETGDFSEEDSDSSTWEGEEEDDEDVDDSSNAIAVVKPKTVDVADASASESEDGGASDQVQA